MDHLSKYILARGHHPQSIDLIKKLLAKEPEQRLSLGMALKHKWFTMKLDIAGRSVGEVDDEEHKKNMIKIRRRVSRMGSGMHLNSKKSSKRNIL